MAKLVFPFASMVPINEALLKPCKELIKAALLRLSICKRSFSEK
jgi:hypothetical protein